MYNIETILVIIIAIIVRIVIQKGNFVLPTIYREENIVRFNWGSLGVIIVGIVAVILSGSIDPNILQSPISIFAVVYTCPALSDAIATKILPNETDQINEGEEV